MRNNFCTLTIDTTGPTPGVHSIVGITLVPLGQDLKISSKYKPFMGNLKPHRIAIDRSGIGGKYHKIIESINRGLDAYTVADFLEQWKSDNFQEQKLSPVCYNWLKIREFLLDWIGPQTVDYLFDDYYFDIKLLELYRINKWSVEQRTNLYQDYPCYAITGLSLHEIAKHYKEDYSELWLANEMSMVITNIFRKAMGGL